MPKSYSESCSLNALAKIVNGENICCLCLKKIEEKEYCIYDEVLLRSDDLSVKKSSSLAQILSILLNKQKNSFSYMTEICEQCVKNTLQSYKFIKKCHWSAAIMSQAVERMTACLETSEQDIGKKNAAYIIFDPEKDKTRTFYDTKICSSSNKIALKRINIKIMKKIEKKEKIIETFFYTENEDFDRNDTDYNCRHCAKTFAGIKGLKAHTLRVHAPKNYKCKQCPRKFGSSYLLKLHKSKSHITVMCSECGKTYNNMHSLKLHESGHHLKLRCPSCSGFYKNRMSYDRHCKKCQQGSNEKLEKYICDICGKEYSQKGSLRVHINFEHGNGKSFSCNWCNKKFPTTSKMKAHMVKHTKEKNFVCSYCGGKFVTKESLLYHTRIHTGEAPYSCQQCDEKFISASRRTDHIRRKHQEATLECQICNKKFRTLFCLKKHKNRHFNPNSSLFIDHTIAE